MTFRNGKSIEVPSGLGYATPMLCKRTTGKAPQIVTLTDGDRS